MVSPPMAATMAALASTSWLSSGSSARIQRSAVTPQKSRSCARALTPRLPTVSAACDEPSAFNESSSASIAANGLRSLVAAASAALVLASPLQLPANAAEFTTYYGTAASASSYGGYGGNANKKDTAEYVYDVPSTWKERAISKVEKGTNGTDSEFFNPKKRTEKTYVTFLAGFRRLPPKDNVLNDIALSDVDLQDLLAAAETTEFKERRENGQVYYDFDIDSYLGHALISVTCAKNKLYAHFVNAPSNDWARDEALLRAIHESFKTVGRDPLAPPDQF